MIYNKVYSKFQKNKVTRQSFLDYMKEYLHLDDSSLVLEVLKGLGFWFLDRGDFFELGTSYQDIETATFCFVDIETTGSKPFQSQIIEIGAIKYCNGKIIDNFQTLVYADFVPDSIVELTGINTQMLKDAPREKQVLSDFRDFLGNSVFVAHNVNFDYSFISKRNEVYGNIGLLNPRLCTVELSKKAILSLRHSLAYLNKFLGINIPDNHRAYSDALACLRVFEIAKLSLPSDVRSVQDLIEFSRGKRF
ncbi:MULTISPECIES: 3'-5' exonuclease [unclassified Helicobacter]|uniref:3'-5' exonuclease n=1 Tax=unclassified Helicobacter TaxID=2593540 RepID=UPI000CF13297|nr:MULTISPECIES: 3'-5' exonuclease [unclassified Helicobacter]